MVWVILEVPLWAIILFVLLSDNLAQEKGRDRLLPSVGLSEEEKRRLLLSIVFGLYQLPLYP